MKWQRFNPKDNSEKQEAAVNDEPEQLKLVRGIRENQKKDAPRRKEGSRRELALMLSDTAEGSLASPERQRQQIDDR